MHKSKTPRASAQGGAWERLICSVRRILSTFMNDPHCVTPSHEELVTLFAEAQCIINSRPLTAVSSNINDCNVITPNTLLNSTLDPTNPFGEPRDSQSLCRYLVMLSQKLMSFGKNGCCIIYHICRKT